MPSFKYKVPCDALLDSIPTEVVEQFTAEQNENEMIGVYLGGADYFPQHELLTDKTISFEFTPADLVGLWCFAKTKKAAKAIVDYIAYQEGEVPSELYDRIIYDL